MTGAANAERKLMALRFATLLGADSIYDTDVLRAGRARRLLGGRIPAASTLGMCALRSVARWLRPGSPAHWWISATSAHSTGAFRTELRVARQTPVNR